MITDYDILSIDELDNLIKNLSNIRYQKIKLNSFPYIDFFTTSTNSGEMVEHEVVNILFSNLKRVTSENFDQITEHSKRKVETKAIRMITKGSGLSYESRAISILNEKSGYNINKKCYGGSLSTTTFQQVKPAEFELLIGILCYKDGMDVFVVNSNEISKKVKTKEKDKIYLSGQHKNNLEEGQININDTILNKNYKFSIYNDGTSIYFFDRSLKQKKEQIFSKLDIEKF